MTPTPALPGAQTSEGACQVPLLELMRTVPRDIRAEWAIAWTESGAEIGHRYAPVGRYLHEAADEIERLQSLLSAEKAGREAAERERDEIRVERNGYSRQLNSALRKVEAAEQSLQAHQADEWERLELRGQANAWKAVVATLLRIRPDFFNRPENGQQCAVLAIEELAHQAGASPELKEKQREE